MPPQMALNFYGSNHRKAPGKLVPAVKPGTEEAL